MNTTMMELARIKQGAIQVVGLENVWIYKVPKPVYQIFFDMIPNRTDYRYNLELQNDTKGRILEQLKIFISEKFPGMVIVNIMDLSRDEAYQIHPNLDWGMYVQLAEGHYDGTIGIGDSLKQLAG